MTAQARDRWRVEAGERREETRVSSERVKAVERGNYFYREKPIFRAQF